MSVLTPFHIHLGLSSHLWRYLVLTLNANRLRVRPHGTKIIVLKLKQCLIKKYSMLHAKKNAVRLIARSSII